MSERSERLTYDEIANVCVMLKEIGIEPTQTKVYAVLGRGSNSTIGRFIKQWQEEALTRPAKLGRSVIRTIEAEIERHSAMMNESLQENIGVLNSQNKELESEVVRLREEAKRLGVELESAKAVHWQEVTGLNSRIEAKQVEIDRLRGLNEEYGQKVTNLTIETTTLRVEAESAAANAANSAKKADLLQKEKEGLIAEVATLRAQFGTKKK